MFACLKQEGQFSVIFADDFYLSDDIEFQF